MNGAVEKDPGRQISSEDEVCFDGRKVRGDRYVYYMLNKPAGVITATEDGQMRTVLDLLRESVSRKGLFPVGRLDRDTEGLLLITDDGQLAHRLLSPAKHVDKTYYAVVTGTVTEEDVRLFAEGLRVDDGFTAMPAVLQIYTDLCDDTGRKIPSDQAYVRRGGKGSPVFKKTLHGDIETGSIPGTRTVP